jgi:sugar phosphate isomerase/epimerase
MQIGIMARTFIRSTLSDTFDAVVSHGIHCIQFNFTCAGLPEMPEHIDPELCDEIREEAESRDISIAAVSGTYNMIHPDLHQRHQGLEKLREMASVCHRLGTFIITLCTGTRDPNSMWRWHQDNDTPEAWQDLLVSMRSALQIAEEYNVILAFEPEVSNVVDSHSKARRLLNQMQSPNLKIVMDPANIFHKGELSRMREIIDEAFVLLGNYIAICHAKDLDRDGEAGHLAAGKGLLDYEQYISWLHKLDLNVPLILHGLSESEVDGCVAFLQDKIDYVAEQ